MAETESVFEGTLDASAATLRDLERDYDQHRERFDERRAICVAVLLEEAARIDDDELEDGDTDDDAALAGYDEVVNVAGMLIRREGERSRAASEK